VAGLPLMTGVWLVFETAMLKAPSAALALPSETLI
jgi:hypothetical protein